MGEFAYASFRYLKDNVLKEMPRGGFGLFVNAWSLCEFCNMEYTYESSFLERGNKVRGVGIKSSWESPRDKHILSAVPCLSRGTLHSRRGCWHTPNRIFHFRKIVPGREV